MKYTATWHHIETLPYKPNWLIRLRFWVLGEDWRSLVIVKEPAYAYINERSAVKSADYGMAGITYKQQGESAGLPCTEEVRATYFMDKTLKLEFMYPIPRPDENERFIIEL